MHYQDTHPGQVLKEELEARKLSAAALNQRPIAEIALAPNQNFVRVMRFPRLNFCDGGGRRLRLHVDRTTSTGGRSG